MKALPFALPVALLAVGGSTCSDGLSGADSQTTPPLHQEVN